MKRKFIAAGAGLAAALCCLALASSDDDAKPAVDTEEFQEFMSHQVGDVYDLEQYFTDGQYSFLPIVPPPEDFILRQPGYPLVLPFTWEKFPEQFVKALVPEYENSVPVFSVTILEDPTTRETVFLNAKTKKSTRFPPQPDTTPTLFSRLSSPACTRASIPVMRFIIGKNSTIRPECKSGPNSFPRTTWSRTCTWRRKSPRKRPRLRKKLAAA